MRTLPIRIVITPSREDAVRGFWETVGRPWSFVAVPVTLAGTAGLVWVQIAYAGESVALALLRASVVPLFILTAATYFFVMLPRKAFDRLPAAWRRTTREIRFSEEFLEYVPPVPGAPTDWGDWRWFVETRNYFALYPKGARAGEAMLIPKAAFLNAQDLEDFRKLVSRKVAAWKKRR